MERISKVLWLGLVFWAVGGGRQAVAAAASSSQAAQSGPAAVTKPSKGEVVVSDLLDLHALCGVESCDTGVHGGTQSRICRTSHGVYAAFMGDGPGGHPVLHLLRIHGGTARLLHTLPTRVSGSNSVHVVCDANEDVYALAAGGAWVDGAERALLDIYKLDRAAGTVRRYEATIPFGRGASFGYSSACIDRARNRIYAVYSGGDAPGYFAWFAFDLATGRWLPEARVTDLAYRHCYNYCFADGRGGMVILSERDIKNSTAGVTTADTNRKIKADYVWDELRLFHIDDLGRPAYTSVDVEKAVYDKPAGLYPNVQNNHGGDTYVDAQGNLHVLYTSDDNNAMAGSFLRHAVHDVRRRSIHNELLEFQGGCAMRMAQAADGAHYIIAMPYEETARVQIWRATDPMGLHYELLKEKQFPTDVVPTYAGLAVSCPRNGSRQDNVIDCLFPAGHRYYYYQVVLPKTGEEPPEGTPQRTSRRQ